MELDLLQSYRKSMEKQIWNRYRTQTLWELSRVLECGAQVGHPMANLVRGSEGGPMRDLRDVDPCEVDPVWPTI